MTALWFWDMDTYTYYLFSPTLEELVTMSNEDFLRFARRPHFWNCHL